MTANIDTKSKVYDLLKSFSTAMFVTVRGGVLSSRPMHVARVEEQAAEVWFLTGHSGSLVEEIETEPRVLLAFQNDSTAFLSLRGKARVVNDKSKVRELWQEPYKVWFPGGPDDPEIALVAVDPTDAEYWDNRGANRVQYLFESAKAYLKGQTPKIDADQHAKTKL